MNTITRRRLLAAIAQIAAVTTLAACDSKQTPGASVSSTGAGDGGLLDTTLLASVCFDLFPYQALPPELYVKVARQLLQQDNPVIAQGLVDLKQRVSTSNWFEMQEAERVAILSTIEETEFFAVLRSTTIEVIYREPEMFALIGYGGSAIEHGGYINRGFDDISWLPQE